MWRLAILLLLLLTRCSTVSAGLPLATALVRVDSPSVAEEHRLYALNDAARWLEAAPDGSVLSYRAAVRSKLGGSDEQRVLLEREREVIASTSPKDTVNDTALLEGKGTVRPISRLELALWSAQNERWPMLTHPTEFLAFVLRRKDTLHVYFSTLDRFGVKPRHEVRARVATDVSNGWALLTVLHNHTFMFDRVAGDRMYTKAETIDHVGGALAPSSNDVRYFRTLDDLHPQEVSITNGIDTSHIAFDALGSFAAADE